MKSKFVYLLKHPATWAFAGTFVGAFCPKCVPWVSVIGNMVAGA